MHFLSPLPLLPFSLDPTLVRLPGSLVPAPLPKLFLSVINVIYIIQLGVQILIFIQFDPLVALDTADHSILETLCSFSFQNTTHSWICFLLPYWLLFLCPIFGSSSTSRPLNVGGSSGSILGPLASCLPSLPLGLTSNLMAINIILWLMAHKCIPPALGPLP